MNKKVLLSIVLSSLFMYSSVASACAYCHGYHSQVRSEYSEDYSKLMRNFEDKRYELNKLYSQGVKETDDNAKLLIKDLDTLSDKINAERESAVRPYENNRYRDHRYQDRCW